MFRPQRIIFFLALCMILFVSGCSKMEPPHEFSSEEEKLISLLKDEHSLNAVVRIFDKTLWVYVATEDSFLNIAATDGPINSKQKTKKQTIHYLDVSYSFNTFIIEYDISPLESYQKSPGYSSAFSEKYQRDQQNVLSSILRSYGGSENAPEFLVLVYADIKTGLEMHSAVAFKDMTRLSSDQTFAEEYAKRAIVLLPTGGKDIIEDVEGKHVDFHDLDWPEFLSMQMKYRIEFKYTRSAFSPSDETKYELMKQAAHSLGSYEFNDYDAIQLKNIIDETEEYYQKAQIMQLIDAVKKDDKPGRLIEINFGLDK